MTPLSDLMVKVPEAVNNIPSTDRWRHCSHKMLKISNHVHRIPPDDKIMDLHILVRGLTQLLQHIHYDTILQSPPASPIQSIVFLIKNFQTVFHFLRSCYTSSWTHPLTVHQETLQITKLSIISFPCNPTACVNFVPLFSSATFSQIKDAIKKIKRFKHFCKEGHLEGNSVSEVKFFLYLIKQHAMKTIGEVEEQLHVC
jgi:hypothetical protein